MGHHGRGHTCSCRTALMRAAFHAALYSQLALEYLLKTICSWSGRHRGSRSPSARPQRAPASFDSQSSAGSYLPPSLVVFSGGTAFNSVAGSFHLPVAQQHIKVSVHSPQTCRGSLNGASRPNLPTLMIITQKGTQAAKNTVRFH